MRADVAVISVSVHPSRPAFVEHLPDEGLTTSGALMHCSPHWANALRQIDGRSEEMTATDIAGDVCAQSHVVSKAVGRIINESR